MFIFFLIGALIVGLAAGDSFFEIVGFACVTYFILNVIAYVAINVFLATHED